MQLVLLMLLLAIHLSCISQTVDTAKNSSTNNLVHAPGYKTSRYDEIVRYTRIGNGKKQMILIPGMGFDARVFEDFSIAYKDRYTIYTITIPGYGNTSAPPMPDTSVSYGEQSWNKSAIKGILKLMEEEHIEKPIIVGHFVQGTQLALRMAIDYPDKVGSLVIVGGVLKYILIAGEKIQDFPLSTLVNYTDTYTAPKWFKAISQKNYNAGNFTPLIYSVDSTRGKELWNQSAAVPLPVSIRYSCEFFASDIREELSKIKCPVLVLRPMFTPAILENKISSYVKPYFVDSWDSIPGMNALFTLKNIPGASTFVWKDRPNETYSVINVFLREVRQ